MSTYRERRLAKAERLREWAGKRDVRAEQASEASDAATAGIPFGQPILVGHHSERAHRRAIERGWNKMGEAVEHGRTAETFRSRADEIERQADGAIYSDDPDARERLTERIAALEAERDRRKAANVAYRREHKAELAAMSAYDRYQAVPYPTYSLSNLSGNISRLRKRLATLDRTPADRTIVARRDDECEDCGAPITRGQTIRYSRANGARCVQCPASG
jgi:hypothetical protein